MECRERQGREGGTEGEREQEQRRAYFVDNKAELQSGEQRWREGGKKQERGLMRRKEKFRDPLVYKKETCKTHGKTELYVQRNCEKGRGGERQQGVQGAEFGQVTNQRKKKQSEAHTSSKSESGREKNKTSENS